MAQFTYSFVVGKLVTAVYEHDPNDPDHEAEPFLTVPNHSLQNLLNTVLAANTELLNRRTDTLLSPIPNGL